ncbi:hypothetical protein ACFXC8_13355 [Streptomyces sp. NPDC059441]|uniref:hypothetical protein n=1 Tax=Streptomyces sp. NPDC059441 TaxID=3346829 RepID=UPI00369152D4
MTKPVNVLTAVLEAHGKTCACRGTCGTEHSGLRCDATHSGKGKPLLAAPQYPNASDTQNAAAPFEDLRPWCWKCWRDALNRERERAADMRRRELEEGQVSLFDVDREPAA